MDEKHAPSPSPSPIQRSLSAVTYCCGACGYDLRLRSSDRNTAGIVGAAYGRAARRGVVAFDAIDDARFGHADEFRCVDLRARRLFVRRTRLLCRKCGGRIGNAYEEEDDARDYSSSSLFDGDVSSDDMRPSSGSGRSSVVSSQKNYVIKISALQPSSDDSAVVPFTHR